MSSLAIPNITTYFSAKLIYIKSMLIVFLFSIPMLYGQQNLFRFLGSDSAYTIIRPVDKNNKIISLAQELNCGSSRHHYLVKNGKLYIQIDGSRKIFSTDSATPPQRIDQTCYEGYNFYAYNFLWNDQFYSLSGWGFWKYDGGLRYYDERMREWFIKPINQKVPVAEHLNSVIWQDIRKNKIYVIYKDDEDAYLKTRSEIKDSVFVQCFDLNRFEWWPEPRLLVAENPVKDLNSLVKLIPTSEGLIIEDKESFKLYDFEKNEIATLNNNKSNYLAASIIKNQNGFYIIREKGLFFYNPETDSISSVSLEAADFKKTGQPVYTKLNKKSSVLSLPMVIIFCLVLCGILVFFYDEDYISFVIN